MSPGEIHGLHARIVADLKRELAEARAEIEQQRTRAEAAESTLLELNTTIGNHPATAAWAKSSIRAIEEAEKRAEAAEQELRAEKERGNSAWDDGYAKSSSRAKVAEAKLAAIRAHLPALKRLHAWVSSERMGEWTYLEGGTFYDDVQEMAAVVADALEALEP